MYQSVLVPIDLSHQERILPMLNQADALCASDGEIPVVHIVPAIPSYVEVELPGDLVEKNMHSAKVDLARLLSEAEIDAKIIVKSDSAAAKGCLQTAEEIDADLIVIASHEPGFSDYFLGSTAARVVRHAHCSVFVMR